MVHFNQPRLVYHRPLLAVALVIILSFSSACNSTVPIQTPQRPTPVPPTVTPVPPTATSLPPTATLVPPTRTPTPATVAIPAALSGAIEPMPVLPPQGGGPYRGAITFQWRGSLGAGQSYRVVVRCTLSPPGVSDVVIQSDLLQTQTWTTDLPTTHPTWWSMSLAGTWQWQVQVVRDGNVLAASAMSDFTFNPLSKTVAPQPGPVAPLVSAVKPELLAPVSGGGPFRNPITFKWRGTLGAGQAYQVMAYSERVQGYVIRSEFLTTTSWTTELPDKAPNVLYGSLVGGWQWSVSVVENGQVMATSVGQGFIFSPLDGRPQPSNP
jgi:hypothetical protein